MRKFFTVFLISLLVMVSSVHAQRQEIDSLEKQLKTEKNENKRNEIRNSLSNEYLDIDVDKAITIANEALRVAKKNKWFKQAGVSYNVIGIAYKRQGKYPQAVKYYIKALELYESIKDKEGVANAYNNLGEVYRLQGNLDMALTYHSDALEIRRKLNDSYWIAASLNNLALVYDARGEQEKALSMHMEALGHRKKLKDGGGIATSLSNIGNFYFARADYAKSLEYYQQSLRIIDSIGDEYARPMGLMNIGAAYYMQKKYSLTEELFLQALGIAKKNKDRGWIEIIYGSLGELYMTTGDYKKAYLNSSRSAALKDSLCSVESANQIAKMNAVYETEKKDADIKRLKTEKEIQNKLASADSRRKNVIIWSAAAGLLLVIAFALFITRSLRLTRRQKNEIEEQKRMVDDKQKEIIDSINYAKRLQEAILPLEEEWKKVFTDHFVLYRPKDIVAGDFYFLEQVGNSVIFAAADCTGHGVPGAMVSVVCSNALNQAIREFRITNPGLILDKVRSLVIQTFMKSSGEIKDGMDISLCSLSMSNLTMEWAGANNVIWIARANTGVIQEIKGDKMPVGKYADEKPFTSHQIQLQKGDTLYLLTDGYQDQFGGEKGKKFKASGLKKLIEGIQQKPMSEQKSILNATLDDWRGTLEQIDDVCIVGIRI